MKKQDKSFIPFQQDRVLAPEEFMSQIPLWVVVCLGKEVMLSTEFVGPCETYAKGCRAVLCGIECYPWNNGGKPYALLSLDSNDPSYVENFKFSDIEPVADRIKYSLDVQRGVIAF
jgi:hypothetical protein